MIKQEGDLGSFNFNVAKTGKWSLIAVSMTPLSHTRSGLEIRITSISDWLQSVILVGMLIIWVRFNSSEMSVSTLFSGHCFSMLQLRSARMIIGLFMVKAVI